MRPILYFLSFALIITLASCAKPYYIINDFEQQTMSHKLVAVLPIEMIFTGRVPEDMDDEDILQLEEAESTAFQNSLHHQILRSNKGGKKAFWVNFQPVSKTNKILQEENISIRESWEMDPEDLGRILGVDAVVRTRVEKKRYLSDLASMGIDIGTTILSVLTRGRSTLYGPNNLQKSNDVFSQCSLINVDDSVVLWSMSDTAAADWQRPANEVIDHINHRIARFFPYRVGKN